MRLKGPDGRFTRPTVGKVPGLCLVTMPPSPEELEHLADELNLLGDHLAELHDRIDPDDADSLDSCKAPSGTTTSWRRSSTLKQRSNGRRIIKQVVIDVSGCVFVSVPLAAGA